MPGKQHRITQGDQYRRVMRHGRRVGGPIVVTHAVLHSPDHPARFGYIVSKKVGNAVTRNLVTRRLKAISDECLHGGLTGVDVVFRAQAAAAEASYAQLRAEVHKVLAKLGVMRDAESTCA